MGKKKSIAFLILTTILLIGLCFVCTVSFHYGTDNMYTFNSIVSMMGKDAVLGGTLADGETYVGGGYSAVYYPDGVLTVDAYEENLAALDGDEKTAYAADHVRYPDANGPLYLAKENVGEDGKPTPEFTEGFQTGVRVLVSRLKGLKAEGVRLDVCDDYTVRVFLPDGVGSQAVIFTYFAYTGDFSLRYGTDADSASPLSMKSTETVRDYVKSVKAVTRQGTSYVAVAFTAKGRKAVADWSEGASDSAATLFMFVGDNQMLGLSVSSQIDQSTLYISNPSAPFSAGTAKAIALTMNTALNGESVPLTFTADEAVKTQAQFGDLALILAYAAFGAAFLGMMIFFFVRYKLLAFAHLYSFLFYLFAMILCVWAIPFLHFGLESLIAVALGGVILSVSDALAYEYARQYVATSKTVETAVKMSYGRSFWQVFDLHVILALFGFIAYFAAMTQLAVFAFTFALGVVFSALCTIAVNRFHWAIMMALASNDAAKARFCNFETGTVAAPAAEGGDDK